MAKMKMKKMLGIGMFGILMAAGGGALFTSRVDAKEIDVSNRTGFWEAYTTAEDGDVIKLQTDVLIANSQQKMMQTDTVLTIDLNGNTLISGTGGDNFGVGKNSVLLFKNGRMDYMDTMNSSEGIVILNNVNVCNVAWLGNTDTWIVNNSRVNGLCNEEATVNAGAANLNPVTTRYAYSEDLYEYDNSAPAMVGSGTTWKCLATLQDDFDQASREPATYNQVILLQDATVSEDTVLSTPGITLNLSGYNLNLTGHKLTMNNDSGTNTVSNGTLNGDLDMASGTNGSVVLDGLTVTGTITNNSHPTTIQGGVYKNIVAGDAKVTIEDGTFAGTLTGSNYEISGGYFANAIPEDLVKEGYDLVRETNLKDGVICYYKVVKHEHSKDTHYAAVAATCSHTGNVEYWECAKDGVKLDADGNVLDNVETAIDPDNHVGETEIRDAKEATSTKEGYTGDTYCKDCGAKIKEGTVIPCKGDSDPVDEKIDTRKTAVALDNSMKIYTKDSNIIVSWDRLKSADKYEVYAAYCGNDYKLVKTTSCHYATIKKLNDQPVDQTEVYKIYVVALRDGKTIGTSMSFHVVGKQNTTYTNAKMVTVRCPFLMLRQKQSASVDAKLVLQNKDRKAIGDDHVATFRYISSNSKVASVDENGKITANGRGEATIFVYAANGRRAEVKVIVDDMPRE